MSPALYHLRGWVVMSFVSLIIFVAAVVPLGYFNSKTPRTIYAAVVTPVVWLIYLVLLYFLVYRPLVQATDVFEEGECVDEDGSNSVSPMTKEVHKLNRNLFTLLDESAHMKAATDMLVRGGELPLPPPPLLVADVSNIQQRRRSEEEEDG